VVPDSVKNIFVEHCLQDISIWFFFRFQL
jgi:hypothetical protein